MGLDRKTRGRTGAPCASGNARMKPTMRPRDFKNRGLAEGRKPEPGKVTGKPTFFWKKSFDLLKKKDQKNFPCHAGKRATPAKGAER